MSSYDTLGINNPLMFRGTSPSLDANDYALIQQFTQATANNPAYQQQLNNLMQTNSATGTTNTTPIVNTSQINPNFKASDFIQQGAVDGSATAPTEEKKTSGWAFAIPAAVVLALLSWRWHGKGAENLKGFSKIKDGCMKDCTSIKNWFSKLFGKVKGNSNSSDKIFTIGKDGITLPDKTKNIAMKDGETFEAFSKQAKNYGVNVTEFAKNKVPDGATIRECKFNIGKENYALKVDGNEYKVFNGAGKEIESKDYNDELSKLLEQIKNNTFDKKKMSVNAYTIMENDMARHYTGNGKVFRLNEYATNRFAYDAPEVSEYLKANPKAQELFDKFNKKEFADLNIFRAEAPFKDVKNTKFIIENGEVKGIKVGDEIFGTTTEKFKELQKDYPQAFKDILNNKDIYENVIYRV